jgi:hypothetical protein
MNNSEKKICADCGKEKSLSEFSINKVLLVGPPNRRRDCKECRAAKERKKYPNVKDRVLKTGKAWKDKNPEKVKAQQKRHRERQVKPMNERTNNYPGKISDDELDEIRKAAEAANLSPAAYIRKRLKLPEVKMGAPAGNRNAVKSEPTDLVK